MTRVYRLLSSTVTRLYWLDTERPLRPGQQLTLVDDSLGVWTVVTGTSAVTEPTPGMLRVIEALV